MTYAKLTEKHADLVALTWEQWDDLTLSDKRKLMGGLVPNASRAKTVDLTEAFTDFKRTYGQTRETLEPDTVQGRAQRFYELLLPLVRQYSGLELAERSQATLASLLAEILIEPDRQGNLPIARLSRAKADLFWYIDDELAEWDAREQGISATVANDRYNILKRQLKALVQPFEAVRNAKASLKLDERLKGSNKPVVDLERLFKLADETLNNPDKADWRDLSISVAFATGRRQVEVHSVGSFVPVGEYEMQFGGAAKKRGNSEIMIIPTMFPAAKVARAWQVLAESGRHYPDDAATTVNAKVAVPLSRRMEKHGLQQTYHQLRDDYALLAMLILMPPGDTGIKYMASILGHENINATLSYMTVALPEGAMDFCKPYRIFGKG